MKLPLDFPRTAFHNVRLTVDCLAGTLTTITAMSTAKMEKGEERQPQVEKDEGAYYAAVIKMI
ncbi:cytochrome P450 710A1-like [Trifolium medium]|uniref:Cytochrome P450 710A1-like n=1 Tax=Trifolium medium TaxID=97028 RepID=A0A392P1K7_9FABA|nr:cytochrome P450 710A1-like [Trifolium medium]